MKILLDTCTFLWWISDAVELSRRARELCLDPENDVVVSVVSHWEITIKWQLGKLPLPEPPDRFVPDQRRAHGFATLAIDEAAIGTMGRLAPLNRDPFDRLLVAQAIAEGMILLTPDAQIARYPVRAEW